MTIWMDLTNSLTQHKGNVVGIVRAELMQAKYLHEIDPSIRFSVLTDYGFREVKKSELRWLFKSQNINDDYRKYQNRKNRFYNRIHDKICKKLAWEIFRFKRHYIKSREISRNHYVTYPYSDGDVVYSCGWFGTRKEEFYARIRSRLQNFRLVYTIYDFVMVKDGLRHLYFPQDVLFDQYLYWISQNCSAIVYGGETAKKDAEEYFIKNNLPILDAYPVKWGNDIALVSDKSDILERLNIQSPYILAVGSIDHKKNYEVLYRAYCIMKQKNLKNIPQLIIVGRLIDGCAEFGSMIKNNPLVKDNIKIIQCSDEDLNELYKNCLFTVLPTLYEGWSLTLPESLYYGKLCLCSDVEPLREVGGDFVCYLNPYNPQDWADKIEYFMNNRNKLCDLEKNISGKWKSISWKDSATHLYDVFQKTINKTSVEEKTKNTKPIIYYDISLLWHNGALSGIPRAQMLLARYLYRYTKDIKYFWMVNGKYNELQNEKLTHLLSNQDLDIAVKTERMAARCSTKNVLPFSAKDIVFSAGVGYDKDSYDVLLNAHKNIGFKYAQVLYDLTPITVPHTHPEERVKAYPEFLEKMYTLSDYIFYGGQTAQTDGAKFQMDNGLDVKDSIAVKWGSDIVSHKYTNKEKQAVFDKYGITGDFILTVGTIEARKNHETLYRAYLELLKDKSFKNLPQFVVCGHPGWKTDTFRRLVSVDNRVRGKFMLITPTDEELDILYQTCKFTCLASFYEGWSLTLPESLNYGKFCLASDTPSLVETGEDIIDYANPYDPVEWAEKIKFYCTNAKALKQREALIKKKWHNTTWDECARNIDSVLHKLMEK